MGVRGETGRKGRVVIEEERFPIGSHVAHSALVEQSYGLLGSHTIS